MPHSAIPPPLVAWLPARLSRNAHKAHLTSFPKSSAPLYFKELPVPFTGSGDRASPGVPHAPGTVGQAGVSQQQLLAGGGWVGFGAIGMLHKGLELPAQGVQQSPDHGVIQLVGGINEVLKENGGDITELITDLPTRSLTRC